MTLRGVLIGLLGAVAVGVGAPYAEHVLQGSYVALDFSTPGALFLFFLLAGGNFLYVRLGRRNRDSASLAAAAGLGEGQRCPRGLSSGELIVVYTMMIVGSAIATMGFTAQILPLISGPFYYDNPANRWAILLQPYLKPAFVMSDPAAVRALYEGLHKNEAIPWQAWARPLAVWLPFILTLYVVMIAAMVVLRKQWAERERLAYPLVAVPLAMAAVTGQRREKPLWVNGLTWIGFGLPFLWGSLKGLNHYFPRMPFILEYSSLPTFRYLMLLPLRISFPMIGFFYLVSTDIVFSLWFFNVVSFIARGVMAIVGYKATEDLGIYGSPSPLFAHLGMGAIAYMVLAGLWAAREHLRRVLRKAFTRAPEVDDSAEALSFRAAFWCCAVGSAFMLWWLHQSGLPYFHAVLFLFAAALIFIGLTRIVVESGVAEAVASTIPSSAVISGVGTQGLGSTGLAAMGLTYVWSSDLRTFVMASAAHGLKMAEALPGKKRGLFWAMMLAVLASMASSMWFTMLMAYRRGGAMMNSWFFRGSPFGCYDFIVKKILNPSGPHLGGWLTTLAGAAVMALLTHLRRLLPWWPFHPLGFVIGTTWIMDELWLSCFIIWVLKGALLRYGGLTGFHLLRPFFLGLILGQFTCNGVWLVVDAITGARGNMIFWI